jgi:glycosyltransferase involved in cell wall biosynthesis
MIRVAVLDMQPIEPAVGGGRVRLLGLYHDLGPGIETRYVGTFDWPGEGRRRLQLSASLTEIDVPLSAEHFAEDAKWRSLAGGVNVIDTAFPILGRLSPDYVAEARAAVREADVVIVSHPWIYPLVAEDIDRARQLLVYDAHNAESVLRWSLLGDRPFNREIAKNVVVTESTLARAADLVVVCSQRDADFFAETLGVKRSRMYMAPNGVFAQRVTPPDLASRAAARRTLGLSGTVAIFLGSHYSPNVEAVRFIAETLAPRFPDVTFAACGGVGGDAALQAMRPANVLLPGTLSEEEKVRYLHAADLAINPMFAGSGTNIKMFDFMAAGLPVLATATGARGIAERSRDGVTVAGRATFAHSLALLLDRSPELKAMGRANRAWVVADFAWERISPGLGSRIQAALSDRRTAPGEKASAEASASRKVASDDSAFAAIDRTRPIAIVSTWGAHCGISEYTSYLCASLEEQGVRVVIIGNDLADEGAATGSHLRVKSARVVRLWSWDNTRWVDSRADLEGIARTLRETNSQALNVQYHPGFYREPLLLQIVSIGLELGLPVSVTLHNSSHLSAATLESLARSRVLLLVHKRTEAERLARVYPDGVRHFAFGIVQHAHAMPVAASRRTSAGGPLIATFGFLRPHKGLLELLGALVILRGVFPGIRLLAKCALYPTDDSRSYHEEVQRFVASNGLEGCVELDSRFCDLGETVAALSQADVIVLPYAPSDEGASGSLATVMSACRPVVVAASPIFDEVVDDVYCTVNNQPEVLAAGIATVLSNPDLLVELAERTKARRDRAAWSRVSREFATTILQFERAPSVARTP